MSREPRRERLRELMGSLAIGAILLQSPANDWNSCITAAKAGETFILIGNGLEVITGP